MRACLLAFAALSISASADAEWYRASSEHFLIYSQQKPEALRQFAENLEKFDGAVRAVRGMGDLPLSQGNRITIFTLRSAADVQRLYGGGFVEGFYRGSAARSVAFVLLGKIPETDSSPPTGSNVRRHGVSFDVGVNTILLHEYSHHLMMQDLAVPYPEWLVEGFAEFMSTAQFEADGSVGLGLPARHRYYGLLTARSFPSRRSYPADMTESRWRSGSPSMGVVGCSLTI